LDVSLTLYTKSFLFLRFLPKALRHLFTEEQTQTLFVFESSAPYFVIGLLGILGYNTLSLSFSETKYNFIIFQHIKWVWQGTRQSDIRELIHVNYQNKKRFFLP